MTTGTATVDATDPVEAGEPCGVGNSAEAPESLGSAPAARSKLAWREGVKRWLENTAPGAAAAAAGLPEPCAERGWDARLLTITAKEVPICLACDSSATRTCGAAATSQRWPCHAGGVAAAAAA